MRDPDPDVDVRRGHEPVALAHRAEVERGHVEDLLERVALVGADVGLEGLLGAQVEEVVLGDQLLELGLDVADLGPGELELVERDVGLLEVAEEAELLGPEDEEGVALAALAAGGAADAVDVLLGVVGGVVLHDPVDVGDVEAAGGDVGAEQDAGVGVAELEEGRRALRLLLLALGRKTMK